MNSCKEYYIRSIKSSMNDRLYHEINEWENS